MENGLTYYILQNKKPENRASLHLVYSVGSILEEENQLGLAHFLEHMAFNGTKAYPKNDLIKYFQSIGLSFGGDLNAHTGFNETVYKLKIPSDPDSLKTGFKILKEWSENITLNEEDVLKERNIILEEWRLSQGLSQRISQARRKTLFGNSLYSQRLPIGTPEIINNATREELKKFYEKWYLPENSAIIAVGDFQENDIENYIKFYFSKSSHTNNGLLKKSSPPLIGETQDSYTIFKDSEITTSNFDISFLKKVEPINNISNLKNEVINILWEGILNSRIDILKKQKDSPLFSGKIYSYNITPKEQIITLSTRLDENKILEGIELIYKNLKILSSYGPSQLELTNEKKEFLAAIKVLDKNSESIENEEYMDEIKEVFLYGNSFLMPKDKLEYLEKILSSITISDIQEIANLFFYKNSSKFLSLPEKSYLNTLDNKKIQDIYMYTMNNKLENIIFSKDVNLETPNFSSGKIISKTEFSDYIQYTLSNGLKVKYKYSNFEKDKVYLKLFKLEGSSVENDKLYFNSLITPFMMNSSGIGNLTVEETLSFMKGKNFQLFPYLNDYEQGIDIISDEENFSLAVDSAILMLTKPNFDSKTFENLKSNLIQQIKNQENSPRALYKNETSKLLNNNNLRRISLTKENLKLINEESIKTLYKKKFSSFDSYNLVAVGSISPEKFEDFLITKLSSLPKESKNASFKKLDITYPKNIVSKEISKGRDEKATITLIYPFHLPYTFENKTLGDAFSEILNIILLEKIREQLGGVYSINAKSNISYTNHGENYLQISFSTDWKNSHKISKAVKNVIEEMLIGSYSEKYLNDIWNTYSLNYETSRKKNNFWFNFIYSSFFPIKDFKNLKPEEYKNIITYIHLNNFLKKAFKANNYIETTLLPEKN